MKRIPAEFQGAARLARLLLWATICAFTAIMTVYLVGLYVIEDVESGLETPEPTPTQEQETPESTQDNQTETEGELETEGVSPEPETNVEPSTSPVEQFGESLVQDLPNIPELTDSLGLGVRDNLTEPSIDFLDSETDGRYVAGPAVGVSLDNLHARP